MRYFWNRISHSVRSLLLFVLIFGTALLVLLYYLGYYDFSFLDPYKDQLDLLRAGENPSSGQNRDPFAAFADSIAFSGSTAEAEEEKTAGEDTLSGGDGGESGEAASSSGPSTGSEPSDGSGGSGNSEPPVNVRLVYDTDVLPDARMKVPTAEELTEQGRKVSPQTVVYTPGRNVLGKLTFSFQLPEFYTDSWRHNTEYKMMPVDKDNPDSELVPRAITFIEEQPSVELYMGYILIENGDKTVVVSAEGEPLCSFKTGRYTPAKTRDREDRPLFSRQRSNGTVVYFHLSEDGKNFVVSDYDPELDGRGLNFDYPADYGHTDTDRIYPDYSEETGLYAYRIPMEYMPEPEPEAGPGPSGTPSGTPAETPAGNAADTAPASENTEAPAENTAPAADAENTEMPADTAPASENTEAPAENTAPAADTENTEAPAENAENAGTPGESETEPEAEGESEEEPEPELTPDYITPYQFRYALPFRDGRALVVSGEPLCTITYVDEDGKPLFPRTELSDGQYRVFGEEGWFVNANGIDRTALYFIGEDGEPLFPTGIMYHNEQDRRVFSSYQLPYTYGIESIGSFWFDHGLVRVRKQIIDFWRYFLRVAYTGPEVKVMDEYDTLIREDGTEFELPVGYTLEGYSEGRLLLSRDGIYGVLSVTGEWIAQPVYADGGPFIGGLAPLKTSDGRWGLIDTEGNIVLPFTYDAISQVSSGLIACWREENGWSILRIME